jgi:predicted amidophosphoribosyltransferase
MSRIPYRIRYWLKKLAKIAGICFRCRSNLNFTRSGIGICPKCGLRH